MKYGDEDYDCITRDLHAYGRPEPSGPDALPVDYDYGSAGNVLDLDFSEADLRLFAEANKNRPEDDQADDELPNAF